MYVELVRWKGLFLDLPLNSNVVYYSVGPAMTRLALGIFYIILFQTGNILFSDDYFFTTQYQVSWELVILHSLKDK